MKKILLVSLAFIVGFCALAADFSTITEKSVKTFISVMPSYRALLKQYGKDSKNLAAPSNIKAQQYYQKLKQLLANFGLSVEDFFALLNRIVSAYPLAKMKSQGVNYPFMNMAKSGVSSAEMNILLQYLPQLDKVLEQED